MRRWLQPAAERQANGSRPMPASLPLSTDHRSPQPRSEADVLVALLADWGTTLRLALLFLLLAVALIAAVATVLSQLGAVGTGTVLSAAGVWGARRVAARRAHRR